MQVIALIIILLATAAIDAQKPSFEAPIETTLCAVRAHPEHFQHKLVEFTAIASHGFEDSMVESDDCPWAVRGNPGVWLEYGGTAKTDTMYCCGPTIGTRRDKPLRIDGIDLPLVEDDLFRQFDTRLHLQHAPQRDSDLVRATMRGRIFARQESVNGRKLWEGYGHMGCCILFVLDQVVAVDPQPVDPRGVALPPPPPPPEPVRK